MTAIPQLDVPDIFVEDDDEPAKPVPTTRNRATTTSAELLSESDAVRPQHRSWASSEDISTYDASYAHPLSFPRATPSMPGHRPHTSAFSFELQEPGGTSSGENSRRGSAVSPAQVRDLLDDSIWVESIRRSATRRQSERRTDQGGY